MSLYIDNKTPSFYDAFYRAIRFHKDGKFREALDAYKEALEIDPYDADTLNNIGCVKDDLGDKEGAYETINKVIRYYPDYAKAYSNRAYLHKNNGAFGTAIMDYNIAIELGLLDSNTFGGRGWCYEKLNVPHKAINDYSKAIDLDSKNPARYMDRARVYLSKNLNEYAICDYRKAIESKYPGCNPNELVTLVSQDRLEDGVKTVRDLLNAGYYLNFGGKINGQFIIITPGTCDRIVLRLSKLHVGKTIKRHLRRYEENYELRITTDINPVMDILEMHYQDENKDSLYLPMLRFYLTALNQSGDSPKAVAVALYKDGRLVAGDIGVLNGRVYTSYTGYHDESSAGTVQLILLARILQEKGFVLWDFGPSTSRWDNYKFRLGADKASAKLYLRLFSVANKSSRESPKRKSKRRLRMPT
jgi:tetratricopeptide (TPR) repeat protein